MCKFYGIPVFIVYIITKMNTLLKSVENELLVLILNVAEIGRTY